MCCSWTDRRTRRKVGARRVPRPLTGLCGVDSRSDRDADLPNAVKHAAISPRVPFPRPCLDQTALSVLHRRLTSPSPTAGACEQVCEGRVPRGVPDLVSVSGANDSAADCTDQAVAPHIGRGAGGQRSHSFVLGHLGHLPAIDTRPRVLLGPRGLDVARTWTGRGTLAPNLAKNRRIGGRTTR